MPKRRIHEKFTKEVFYFVGNEFEVLGKYIDTRTRVDIKHNVCGYIWGAVPKVILRKKNIHCPECHKSGFKTTTDSYKKDVFKQWGDEYKVIGEYVNSKIHIKMKHKCGCTFETKPNTFKCRKKRCPDCFPCATKKKDTEKFKQDVFKKYCYDYEVLGEYKNNHTKIDMKHSCGCNFEAIPGNFLSGQKKCPDCFGKYNLERTTESFKEEVFEMYADEYSVLDEFKAVAIHITMQHNKCGFIYQVTPESFLQGRRCPDCYGTRKKTTEEFKKEVFEAVGVEYSVLGEYKTNKKYITMQHNECGYVYKIVPNSFKIGTRCPKCNLSKGEAAVAKVLDKLQVKYDTQNDSCINPKSKHVLPFDFAIMKDEKPIAFIEYDGELHFKPFKHFGGEKRLKACQERDRIKSEFAATKKIPLLRIPYTEFKNIEQIVKEFITELGANTDYP
ncbi:hypothetical protein ACQKMK_17550 [Viridibacillus arvi]|uniref:hypothetical protein n=1 Tax=Viridibacillus arvi TaxID=263475 RepID=UPI003D076B08